VADAVAAWRDVEGKVPARIAELAELLQRARIEARFLSRKSPSGGTGSYLGQFEALRPDRRRALEVCLSILLDTAYKEPGQFPSGTYRYLRPPPFLADRQELRHMALNAIAELATPEDLTAVRQLEEFYQLLAEVVDEKGRIRGNVEAGLMDGVLATLARLDPATWRQEAMVHVLELARDESWMDEAAAMCLRLGEYARAVKYYRDPRRQGSLSLASYNMACALARWSLDPGPKHDAGVLRDLAVQAMSDAVQAGYADWAWMEQDRDLDPIRESPRFLAMVEKIKRDFASPGPAQAPKRGPR
jgi:hypothetical protein